MDVPEIRYAREGLDHVAYQTLGAGPPDIVYLGAWFSNVEASWDFPPGQAILRRIASFGRVIHFDKRGTGLSDPVPLQNLPTRAYDLLGRRPPVLIPTDTQFIDLAEPALSPHAPSRSVGSLTPDVSPRRTTRHGTRSMILPRKSGVWSERSPDEGGDPDE